MVNKKVFSAVSDVPIIFENLFLFYIQRWPTESPVSETGKPFLRGGVEAKRSKQKWSRETTNRNAMHALVSYV